jgi:para-aminobenzoate synthetase/4-amino-4-deoxychorismate lyase
MPPPLVLLESFTPGRDGRSFLFSGWRETVVASSTGEVVPALHRIASLVEEGLHAAGYIAYEAAPAFDPCLPALPPAGAAPLLWFGLFRRRREVEPPFPLEGEDGSFRISDPLFALERLPYAEKVEAIRNRIAAGDCYQANLAFPLRFRLDGSPAALYRAMCRGQRAPFCAFIDTGDTVVASASPELFFRIDGMRIATRPMKGTARRAPLPEDDRARADGLRESVKERAENLMIVDLLRNDLGRVCEPGSISVPSLFEVESYDTVHQMTSTVTGTLRPAAGFPEVLSALFPCGSVTGAPKRRSMEILAGLEGAPRGIYTGAVGFLSPGGGEGGGREGAADRSGPDAVFSVAIRTAVLDREGGRGSLSVGSGITWDSDGGSEYDECLAKAAFLLDPPPPFRLVETVRAEGGKCPLLPRHLARLCASASRFGFPFDGSEAAAAAERCAREAGGEPRRVRLLLSRSGELSVEASPLPAEPADRPVAFSSRPVDPGDPLLYHKTTHRPLYEGERERHPALYEVLFVNGRGEVTEGTFNNVAVRRGGRLTTPPVRCGLLPGVLREEMIARGELEEEILTVEELEGAEEVLLLNALRGARRARPVLR